MRAGFGNRRKRYSNVRLETCLNKIFNSFNMTKELQVLVLSWLSFGPKSEANTTPFLGSCLQSQKPTSLHCPRGTEEIAST
jgi:hypothetical protein